MVMPSSKTSSSESLEAILPGAKKPRRQTGHTDTFIDREMTDAISISHLPLFVA
jgi:hypothetical protein